jgi:uncharacterized glyoxalase superfamily protein PhnB
MVEPTTTSAGGVPTVVPVLVLADVEAAKNFYHRAFGFSKQTVLLHADGRMAFAELGWPGGGGVSLISPEFVAKHLDLPETEPAWALMRVLCDDVDGLFARAVAAGATVLAPPGDRFWGSRDCLLRDPYGHIWAFTTIGRGEFRVPPEGV